MRRCLVHLVILGCFASLAACRSATLVGKWRVTKSSAEQKEKGIARLEFVGAETFNERKIGKLHMVNNDGTSGSDEYNAYPKQSPAVISMSVRRDRDLFEYFGIYKFESGKLILKVAQNVTMDQFTKLRPPRDFNPEPGFDILELEREQ